MRLYIDTTGGDNCPQAPVEGAITALRVHPELTLTLGGKAEEITPLLAGCEDIRDRLDVDDCRDDITCHDAPVMAVRQKKDSPIVKGMLKVRAGECDGFVSSGSTGAVLAGGMFRLGRIPGIDRPAIAPLLPNGKGYFLLIDCGANVDCRPEYLAQFALMGSAYMERMMNLPNPRVGLLNIGAEAEKGNALVKAAYPLLQETSCNFVGNVEGRDITHDQCDVLVCDGFDGNIVLKFMEGVAGTLMSIIKQNLLSSFRSKIGALLAKPAFKKVAKAMDYTEVGGAPLLGVNGAVVKAHGSSNGHAMLRAIEQAMKMVEQHVNAEIASKLQSRTIQEEQ